MILNIVLFCLQLSFRSALPDIKLFRWLSCNFRWQRSAFDEAGYNGRVDDHGVIIANRLSSCFHWYYSSLLFLPNNARCGGPGNLFGANCPQRGTSGRRLCLEYDAIKRLLSIFFLFSLHNSVFGSVVDDDFPKSFALSFDSSGVCLNITSGGLCP